MKKQGERDGFDTLRVPYTFGYSFSDRLPIIGSEGKALARDVGKPTRGEVQPRLPSTQPHEYV